MNSVSQALNSIQSSHVANTYASTESGSMLLDSTEMQANTDASQVSGASDRVTLSNQTTAQRASGPEIAQEQFLLSPRAIRAQKIEAMAQDFFADGQFSNADIPKLIQRLHQDGILSDGQLNRLSQAGFEIPTGDSQHEHLLAFVEAQADSLRESKPDSVMITILDDAKSVLEQMDQADRPASTQKAARVSAQLGVFVQGDLPMAQSDKSLWQGLKSTMQLVASMGSSQQSSGQLQSYLALSKRIT